MRYFVYVNRAVNKAIVHVEGCSFVKVHGGEHNYGQGEWMEFASRAEAFTAMQRSGRKERRACKACAP